MQTQKSAKAIQLKDALARLKETLNFPRLQSTLANFGVILTEDNNKYTIYDKASKEIIILLKDQRGAQYYETIIKNTPIKIKIQLNIALDKVSSDVLQETLKAMNQHELSVKSGISYLDQQKNNDVAKLNELSEKILAKHLALEKTIIQLATFQEDRFFTIVASLQSDTVLQDLEGTKECRTKQDKISKYATRLQNNLNDIDNVTKNLNNLFIVKNKIDKEKKIIEILDKQKQPQQLEETKELPKQYQASKTIQDQVTTKQLKPTTSTTFVGQLNQINVSSSNTAQQPANISQLSTSMSQLQIVDKPTTSTTFVWQVSSQSKPRQLERQLERKL